MINKIKKRGFLKPWCGRVNVDGWFDMKEKALTIGVCLMGVSAVAYGMITNNNGVFIVGLVLVIGGYLRIRKKMKASLGDKA